ncbi:MAG: hypothetical protein IJX39_06645 [Clostridia bacterium]|nr:hypothetical protein [Clostridia bacterium]
MKKRRLILIIIALLAVSGTVTFFITAGGRTYSEDGLRQNSRMYMENVCYRDGTIYYTIVNQTYREFTVASCPNVNRNEDGQWKSYPLYTIKPANATLIKPFSTTQHSFKVEEGLSITEGEYRLTYWYGDRYHMAGYLTVTADMLP